MDEAEYCREEERWRLEHGPEKKEDEEDEKPANSYIKEGDPCY